MLLQFDGLASRYGRRAPRSSDQEEGRLEVRGGAVRLGSLSLVVAGGWSFDRWLDDIAYYTEADGQAPVLVAQRNGMRTLPSGMAVLEVDVLPGWS